MNRIGYGGKKVTRLFRRAIVFDFEATDDCFASSFYVMIFFVAERN